MAGWDDPRYLQMKIEALEKQLAELRKFTLPFAVHQRGTMPGRMRAVALNDPGQKGSMWANYDNTGPGAGPYSAVTDTNGIIRAEWGSLAANGVSGAQFGFRANDASGVPIFDSLGLIAAASLLGSTGPVNVGPVTGNGSWQSVSGSSVSFSLARTTRVLMLGAMQLSDPTLGDTGYTLSGSALIDGGQSGPILSVLTTPSLPLTVFTIVSLAGGAHTAALGVNQTNTHSWSVGSGYVFALQLGG